MIVCAPPFSVTVDGLALIVIPLGASSSSVIVSDVSVTARAPEVPSTLIVSFGSSSTSSVGVSVKVSVPLAAPAPISIVSASTTAV